MERPSSAPRPPTRNKVGFLCVGAQKGGTTWLNEQLLVHPAVYLPPIKEVHYFNYVCSPADRKWIPDHYQRPALHRIRAQLQDAGKTDWRVVRYYAELMQRLREGRVDEHWYAKVFALCDDDTRLKGDITPAYLTMPSEGIRAVHDYNPTMRLIAMLREPVARAISAARMMFKWQKITAPDDAQWRAVLKGNGVQEKSRYSACLGRWLEVFPGDQLLVMPYERIEAEPSAVTELVCDFLAIDRLDAEAIITERVHAGKDYEVPDWVVRWLDSRLAEERTSTTERFPHLAPWWQP